MHDATRPDESIIGNARVGSAMVTLSCSAVGSDGGRRKSRVGGVLHLVERLLFPHKGHVDHLGNTSFQSRRQGSKLGSFLDATNDLLQSKRCEMLLLASAATKSRVFRRGDRVRYLLRLRAWHASCVGGLVGEDGVNAGRQFRYIFGTRPRSSDVNGGGYGQLWLRRATECLAVP